MIACALIKLRFQPIQQLLKVDFSIINGLGHAAIFGEGVTCDDAYLAIFIINQALNL